MFRSSPERTLLGYVPLRHVLLVVLLLGLAVTGVLVLSVEREKEAMERLAGGPGLVTRTILSGAQRNVVRISGIFFGLAVVGVTAVMVYHNYRSVGQVLERTKSHARNILESIPSGVLTVNEGGRIASVNSAACRTLGLVAPQVLWRPYADVFRFQPQIREILRMGLDDAGYVQDVELAQPRAESGPLVVRVSTSALRDLRGTTGGVVLLIRDCSELAELERQLRQADKLASLGTLSSGLAHELKNPLSAIALNLHLLVEELRSLGAVPPGAGEYLDVIQAEVRRLNALAENFLRLSRPAPPQLGPVDLVEVVRRVLSLIRPEAETRKVEVRPDLPRVVAPVLGEADQLSQVFLNVMLNGVQAMPEGGTLRVGIVPAPNRSLVEVEIADSGVGIAAADIPRVFEPYFTRRPEGLGLGLAIAKRIVEDHRGTIRVQSVPGVGTRVTIGIPVAAVGAEA